jgi:DNA-binding response OmpR family regulator
MENTVLIIEKDREYREYLTGFFSAREFAVTGCADYGEAQQAVAEKRFDVAIVDYSCGNDGGEDFCKRLMRRYRGETALVIMSDCQASDIELAVRQHGPAFYFVKPFPVDNLYAVVLRIFESRDKRSLRQHKKTAMASR